MIRTGLYPGTFDPITNGHLDIVQRAVKLVDKLVIGVAINRDKGPFFTLEERVEMVREETRRFAKRQETWFRKEPDVTWFSAQELKRQIPGVLEHAKHRGLGRAYG